MRGAIFSGRGPRGAGRARPDHRRRQRGGAGVHVPSPDHARRRLRRCSRPPRAGRSTGPSPNGTSAPALRSSSSGTRRCSRTTGNAPASRQGRCPIWKRPSERALRGGAFREAAQFYRQLSEKADPERDGSRLALWQKGEASAYYYLGELGPGRELLERTLAHLDRPVPKGGLSLLRGLLRAVTSQLMHLALPGRYREQARGREALSSSKRSTPTRCST